MNNMEAEECDICGNFGINDDLIFHELYCYDVYVVSAPYPQNAKQCEVDGFMTEHIVQPLENRGFKCYHGSRNITGGESIIQAMSFPITIIPTTIVPVFKDKSFSALRNFLLRADCLQRIVFLTFDSTRVEPIAISKTSYSISVKDGGMLQKIIQTIMRNGRKEPLEERRRKYETRNESESTVISNVSGNCRQTLVTKSDKSRKYQNISIASHSSQDLTPFYSEISKVENDVHIEVLRSITSPDNLRCYCHHSDEKICHFAAKCLAKLIQKDITKFYSTTHLQNIEKEVRYLIEKEYDKKHEMSSEFEKLYFWTLVAIYFKIYKCNDTRLKTHMRTLTLKKYKSSQKPFDKLYQQSYHKLSVSILAKIKTWANRLDKNDIHVEMLENCISLIDKKTFSASTEISEIDQIIKCLKVLPWDIKHIFVVLITEKILEKQYAEPGIGLFAEICNSVWKKHTDIFFDMVELVVEYIQENYTKGSGGACLKLLKIILDCLKMRRKKDDKLVIILKHFFKKLIYHPLHDVRTLIAPLLFSDDLNDMDISLLGSLCIRVNNHLVEKCIYEKLSNVYPDLVFKDHPQTMSNAFIFDVLTSSGDALIYMLKQETLNDILQTNTTDDAYESFQETTTAVTKCQGHENIAQLMNVSTNGIPPFYTVESGKPLLSFLHEKENQLTWLHMINILIDITMAVNHCHNNDVLLRDITPASFVVISCTNGSFQTKLASFLYAKCIASETYSYPEQEYIADIDFLCFQGEHKESIAAYFSAPESFMYKTFSKCSEVWMLAATFYSILLYGRQPFQELSHLSVFDFVKEIASCHNPEIPNSMSPDLWKILHANLNFAANKRMLIETLLQELESFKTNLRARKDLTYTVKSVCAYIKSEDIQRGYLDAVGCFTQENKAVTSNKVHKDSCKRSDRLSQMVSVRMNLRTRNKIKALNHPNILHVEEIQNGPFTTTLVYQPFGKYSQTLHRIGANIDLEVLLTYFDQLIFAMQELHSHNILHCDLRCSHVYVDPEEGTLKLGHFGRAVTLEDKHTNPYAFKMMPHDAKKWSAPEVKINGMYSYASDIYSLATVFWEAVNTYCSTTYINQIVNMKRHGSKDGYEELLTDKGSCCYIGLLDCMSECWSANPTKRPSLDSIKETINHLRRNYEEYGVLDMNPYLDNSAFGNLEVEQKHTEYGDLSCNKAVEYNTPSLSLSCSWESVVYELVSNKGIIRNRTMLIDFKETPGYQDVGINLNKTKKNFGKIL